MKNQLHKITIRQKIKKEYFNNSKINFLSDSYYNTIKYFIIYLLRITDDYSNLPSSNNRKILF